MGNFKEFWDDNLQKIHRENEVVDLYTSRTKIDEIVQKTGKTVPEIYRILKKHNITPCRLCVNHQAVVDFYKSGLPIDSISELTGYTSRNVRNIVGKLKTE